MKPLLVGEANPYGADPRFALYPKPEGSAGDRLCRLVLGLSIKEYIRHFDRINLCAARWSMREARETARAIKQQKRHSIVLLGAKVCRAFEVYYRPFELRFDGRFETDRLVILPHPSGRCRAWNDPGSLEIARGVLRNAGVLPPLIEGGAA